MWTAGQMLGVSPKIQRTSIYRKNLPVTYFPVGTPQTGTMSRYSFRVNDVKRQGKFPSNGICSITEQYLDAWSVLMHIRTYALPRRNSDAAISLFAPFSRILRLVDTFLIM